MNEQALVLVGMCLTVGMAAQEVEPQRETLEQPELPVQEGQGYPESVEMAER